MRQLYRGGVTLRAPRAERLLAWAAALVGVIGLVSALTPEIASRVELVGGILPPGWPEAARVVTVACALGLIWLSRSLARLRRRAPRQGPRLRGGDRLAAAARRARALAAALRRAGRSGERPAAARPRRGAGGARRRRGRRRAGWGGVAPPRGGRTDRTGPRPRPARRPLLAAPLRPGRGPDRQRPAGGQGARGGLRPRQPRLLRASPRQELPLLPVAAGLPRLPGGGRDGARQRRPGGGGGGARRTARRAGAPRAGARLAARRGRRVRGILGPLPGAGAAPAAAGGGGRAATRAVQPRGARDPQGAPVGLQAAPRWLLVPGRRLGRGRPCARGRARARLRRLAARAARAWVLDGDRRSARARHRARARGGRGRPRRRLPPSRTGAGRRRLVAQHDATAPRRSERADRVPRRGDARLGARRRSERAVPQLLRLRRPAGRRASHDMVEATRAPRPPARRQRVPARAPVRLQPQVLPRMAAPVHLRGAIRRPAGSRPRVPPRRVAARAPRPVGAPSGSGPAPPRGARAGAAAVRSLTARR